MRAKALLWIAAGLAVGGCRARGDQLAELAELHGLAERDFAAKPEKWDKADVGETFRSGDALRTGKTSDAYVRLTRGGGLKLGADSLIRFRSTGGARHLLGIEAGEAEIESGAEELSFDTRLGEARIDPKGKLHVTAAGTQTRFEVLVGQTILENADGGAPTRLAQGDAITLDIGGAVIEKKSARDPTTAPVVANDVAKPDPAATSGRITAALDGDGAQVQFGGKTWAPLPAGNGDIAPGSRVRLPKGTKLSVDRGGEHASVRGAGEVVVGAPGGALLDTIEGDVSVDASEKVVRIDVPGGSIITRQGGRSGVSVHRGRPTDVVAEQGEVEVRGNNTRTTINTGQRTSVARNGELEAEDAAPSRVDFSIAAGESPVVHDPSAPTAVRIQFSTVCPGDGEVEISGGARKRSGRSRGTGSAVVLAAPGANRYRVRCLDEGGPSDVRAQGSIAVAKDSGAAQLPRRAPHNTIDADGRRYTVLYQNLLPQLTVDWPRAPAGKSLLLHLEPERGTSRTMPTQAPSVKFASGQLGEGTYNLWFEVDGDSHRSPQTTLKIDFDNAAPAAHIQEPAAGAPITGKVTVAGIAVEGATVSVGGMDIPLDPQFRFRGEASAGAGDSSLAIRIVHPKHGVHYYLRRLQKGEP